MQPFYMALEFHFGGLEVARLQVTDNPLARRKDRSAIERAKAENPREENLAEGFGHFHENSIAASFGQNNVEANGRFRTRRRIKRGFGLRNVSLKRPRVVFIHSRDGGFGEHCGDCPHSLR